MTPEPVPDLDDDPGPVPGDDDTVSGISLLRHLGDRRQEIVQSQTLDLQVPRWKNPEIWVRYRPVDFSTVDRARRNADKAKGDKQSDAILLANIDSLIAACVAVYATLEDDDEHRQFSLRQGDPEGPLTTFDRDLAVNLGLNSEATGRQIVRALFFTDGDILDQAQRVGRWSGYRGDQADDDLGES